MPTAFSFAFADYLSHADAGVRSRAWVWQSAVGLQLVEGRYPSAYLLETACRHIEGSLPLEMVGKLVDVYYLTQCGAATEAADRKALEMALMLGAGAVAVPAASAAPTAAPPPEVETPAAPVDFAAQLHLRQKRLLRTLGAQTLGVPELLHALRLTSRQSFMRVWLSPAMDMGLVKALHPDSPRHPQQKYLLTRKGQRFLKQLTRK